jgi:hypothetical protein
MPCRKGTKQIPPAIIDEIIREHANGLTKKALAEKYDKPFETIKSIIRRENEKKRKLEAGIALKKKGRPTKNCLVTGEDKLTELRYKLHRKDYRIKQLEMENELLQDFLKEIGRG